MQYNNFKLHYISIYVQHSERKWLIHCAILMFTLMIIISYQVSWGKQTSSETGSYEKKNFIWDSLSLLVPKNF